MTVHTAADWFYLVLGSAALSGGLFEFRRARASSHWPVRQAAILESYVEKLRDRRRGGGYRPHVRYAYRYDGVEYQGNRIMFTGFELSSSREDVERFLRPLAKGASIPVRVCPRKPQLSVIEPGVDRRLVVMLAVGAFLIFLGTADLAGWLK